VTRSATSATPARSIADTTDCKTKFDPNDRDKRRHRQRRGQLPRRGQQGSEGLGQQTTLGDACDPCPQQAGTCAFTIKQLRGGQGAKPAGGTAVKVAVKGATVVAFRTRQEPTASTCARARATSRRSSSTPQTDAARPPTAITLEGRRRDRPSRVSSATSTTPHQLEQPHEHHRDLASNWRHRARGPQDQGPAAGLVAAPSAHESQLVRVKTAKVAAFVDATASDDFWRDRRRQRLQRRDPALHPRRRLLL
jgi:hypothetical protein